MSIWAGAWRGRPICAGVPPSGAPSSRLVELERGGIDAIAQARGRGAVLEHVPEMRATMAAYHFGAPHGQRRIVLGRNVVARSGPREARPSGAGVELVIRAEELGVTTYAAVDALVVIIPVGAGERGLGASFTR